MATGIWVLHRRSESAERLFEVDSGKEIVLWDASHYCSDALKLAEKTGKDVTSLRQNTMRYLLTCVDNDMTSPESVVDPWKQEALSDSAIMSVEINEKVLKDHHGLSGEAAKREALLNAAVDYDCWCEATLNELRTRHACPVSQ